MQYLQVLRKFKYFCKVAIMRIKQICCTVVVGKLYFVQKIELLYFLLYQTVCMTVMVVCKNWPHVFLVIDENFEKSLTICASFRFDTLPECDGQTDGQISSKISRSMVA